MANGSFVAYFRVSTDRQGRSGLGLEAQREAVMSFLNGGNWSLVAEFTECESGKRDDRPELVKAIASCRKHKATLIVAKLDRLSRNLGLIVRLREAKVNFAAADNPHATTFTVNILASVAEWEREAISARTKAALGAAKARGAKLGLANPKRDDAAEVSKLGTAAVAACADGHAANVLPIIHSIRVAGQTSLRAVAAELNSRSIKTARGGEWHATTVKNVLDRASSS